MDWQPISTFKEGAVQADTIVLGYWPSGDVHSGYVWRGEWYSADGESPCRWRMPSHWMPLPAPPSSS